MRIGVSAIASAVRGNTENVAAQPQAAEESRVTNPVDEVTAVDEKQKQQQREDELTPEMVQAAAEAANAVAKAYSTEIKFEVHEETHIQRMTIVDSTTGSVIKEVPPEAILDMIGKLWEKIGILIDKKA